MNDETKKRRCMSCGKLLISEKMPICGRCILEGRNKVVPVLGGMAGGMFALVRRAKALAGDKENGDSSSV